MDTPRGKWSEEYNNDVFVFDVQENLFGTAAGTSVHDPSLMPSGCGAFPFNDNLPQVNVLGDRLFAIGGENNDRIIDGDRYAHYPRAALIGTIKKTWPDHDSKQISTKPDDKVSSTTSWQDESLIPVNVTEHPERSRAEHVWLLPHKTDDAARSCGSSLDCSLNGDCDAKSGQCKCDAGWKGPGCARLDLASQTADTMLNETNMSTWGAPTVYAEGAYHAYVSEMVDACGTTSWVLIDWFVFRCIFSPRAGGV
jgi:hypothetical protein